jgi:hypothetical protein
MHIIPSVTRQLSSPVCLYCAEIAAEISKLTGMHYTKGRRPQQVSNLKCHCHEDLGVNGVCYEAPTNQIAQDGCRTDHRCSLWPGSASARTIQPRLIDLAVRALQLLIPIVTIFMCCL